MLESPPLEHLSPNCTQALALRQVLGAAESDQPEAHHSQSPWSSFTLPALPVVREPVARDRSPSPWQRRGPPAYRMLSGNLQIPIPEEVDMGERLGQARAGQDQAGAAGPGRDEREAHRRMMATEVRDLKYICKELEEIYGYLSANDEWAELAGHLGLCHRQVEVFRGIFQGRPGTPTGQTFLEAYMARFDLSVRFLLQALLNMPRDIYQKLAQSLWTAALLNNSQYYIDLRRMGRI